MGTAVPGRDQYVFDALGLVGRRASHQSHTFGNSVDTVQVRLADLTTVSVGRQASTDLEVAFADEVLGFAWLAEAQFFELRKHQRGEVVVQDRGVDVIRGQAALAVQLTSKSGVHLRYLRCQDGSSWSSCADPCYCPERRP